MKKTSFEDILAGGGTLYYTNIGDSMMPLIREKRDILVILPRPTERLKRGDVPLYKRDTGEYVLHRIVKVRKYDYVLRGDNRYRKEQGVADRHIIGLLHGIIRDGELMLVSDRRYKQYCRQLFLTYPLRYLRYFSHRLWRKIPV